MQTRSKSSVAPKLTPNLCSTTLKPGAPKPSSKSNDCRVYKKPPTQPVLASNCPIRPVLPPKPVFDPLPTIDRSPQLHLPSTIDSSNPFQLFQLFLKPEDCRYRAENTNIYARIRGAGEKTMERPGVRPWKDTNEGEITRFLGLVIYFSRVAYKDLLALPVKLVSSRCSGTTLALVTQLTHCSLCSAIIRCCMPILVPVSRSCHVDFVKFRRRPQGEAGNGLPWLQNWSLISRTHAMTNQCSDHITPYLLPSIYIVLPSYLSIAIPLFSQHAPLAPLQSAQEWDGVRKDVLSIERTLPVCDGRRQ